MFLRSKLDFFVFFFVRFLFGLFVSSCLLFSPFLAAAGGVTLSSADSDDDEEDSASQPFPFSGWPLASTVSSGSPDLKIVFKNYTS